MSENQTQQGEINEDNQPLPEGDDLLEQIAQRRFESNDADTTQPDSNTQARREEQAAAAAQDRHLVDDLGNTFVKAKVYGEEREVPIADLLKNYQINEATETKLAQAKALEHQYQQRLAELENQPAPRTETVDATDKKAAFSRVFDAWSNGEELPDEDIAKLFGNTSQQQPVQIDPDIIVEQVITKFQIKDDLNYYREQYPEIANDPELDDKTAKFLVKEVAQGKPFREALIDSAEQTRNWLRQKAGVAVGDQKPSQTSDAAQKRANAQANLRNTPPSTASARQPISAPKQPSIEEIRRQTINEMMEGN